MFKKLAITALAATMAFGTMTTFSDSAEARRGRNIGLGIAAGVIGLTILGAAARANNHDRHYYRSSCYRTGGECYWKSGSCYINRHGEEVCRRGYKVCEPVRTICD